MATHSSVLAWKIPGTGEPGRLPSMGSHRVRHDWNDLAAAAAAASVDRSSRQKIQNKTVVLRHIWPLGLNRYLQDIPTQNRDINILHKCTWNVLQDRWHVCSTNLMDQNNIKYFFWPQCCEIKKSITERKMGKEQICGDQTTYYYKMNGSTKKLENTSRHMKIETKHPQIDGMQQK